MASTMLWYDLETFGTHPQWDRIGQFAAVRTNDKFEQIKDTESFYCSLSPDYLPNPEACLVSGLTPQFVNAEGLSDRDFAARINRLMLEPNTCIAGYNNLRFDDEFIRSLFYRNFFDPYKREYNKGNTRWDIIDLLRMAHDLRPEGIEWPADGEGRPSFKLTDLTAANGIAHEEAHNALSDVKATIALARLLLEKQPKLFRFFFSLRKKDEARRLLNLQKIIPLVHSSGMFTSEKGCSSIVVPLSVHPLQPNVIISYDLRHDPADWIDEPAEEIRRRVFTRQEELVPEKRIPLKGIHLNRCPAIAPLSTLSEDRAGILGIDLDLCMKHAGILAKRNDLIQKIRAVYQEGNSGKYEDPELQIYSGDFFPDEDRIEFDVIRSSPPEKLLADPPRLHDRRGPELLWRYIGRNYPEAFPPAEQAKWKSFCAGRLLTPEAKGAVDFGTFSRDVKNRLSRVDTPAKDKRILKALLDYAKELERTVLQ
ncbi:MAG: exodeoxyribonuclease I [Spirochaetales bacterium]|nr:MAG: exodeoxyribonuclease I [Spirochaetales bacterium]